MSNLKAWFFYAVFMVFAAAPLLANEIQEISENDKLMVNINDGLVSVSAEDVPLSKVLKEIGEKSTPPFEVKSFNATHVTAKIENQPLRNAIAQLAKKNYAIVFDKQTNRLKIIFLLPEGSGTSTVILDEDRDIAKIFPGPQSNEPQRIYEYTKEQHECLQNIIRQEPDRQIPVHISLKEFAPAKEMMSMVPENKFTISTIYHGWGEMNGGYSINKDDSRDEALHDFTQHHEQFLQNLLETANDLIEKSEQNPEREQSVRTLIQTAKEQLSMVKQGIIMTYGMEVTGKARAINDLISDLRVRHADSTECHEKIMDIVKKEGYYPRTIFIPTKPNNDK